MTDINLMIGTLTEPRWRNWLRLKPRLYLYDQTDGTRIAVFKPGGHDLFYDWMDQRGAEIAQLIKLALDEERSHTHMPNVRARMTEYTRDASLG
jgi:hypothetical protein